MSSSLIINNQLISNKIIVSIKFKPIIWTQTKQTNYQQKILSRKKKAKYQFSLSDFSCFTGNVKPILLKIKDIFVPLVDVSVDGLVTCSY